jgi:hypothetical protein
VPYIQLVRNKKNWFRVSDWLHPTLALGGSLCEEILLFSQLHRVVSIPHPPEPRLHPIETSQRNRTQDAVVLDPSASAAGRGAQQCSEPRKLDRFWLESAVIRWLTEMRRLKQLEDENSELRKVVADLSLDKEKLQDVISAAPQRPRDSSLRNGTRAAPETRFEHAATAHQARAFGAGGTIRLASRRGGQLPCHAGAARRWRP